LEPKYREAVFACQGILRHRKVRVGDAIGKGRRRRIPEVQKVERVFLEGVSSIFYLSLSAENIKRSCPVEKGGEPARANSDKGKEYQFIKLWRTKK
jgi:hypothetical protein